MRQDDWRSVENDPPPDKTVVDTIIADDCDGHNRQELKRSGRLWFIPDGSMYVYYVPTHWRPVAEAGATTC